MFGGLRVKETQRNKFIPSTKKIRNLILSIRNETRYSKINQDKIEHLKEQWMENGDVFLNLISNKILKRSKSIWWNPRFKHGVSKVIFLSFNFSSLKYSNVIAPKLSTCVTRNWKTTTEGNWRNNEIMIWKKQFIWNVYSYVFVRNKIVWILSKSALIDSTLFIHRIYSLL